MDKCNEISQKIQSKIRKKLDDLNAYLDDELPDYIMIMIANQKTESQMTDSLSLFLGDNTVAFTKWLYQLLGALRNSSADSKGDEGGVDEGVVESCDVKSSDVAQKQEHSTTKQSEPVKKSSQQDEIIEIPDEFDDFLDVEYVEESVSCEPEHKQVSPPARKPSREASIFDEQENDIGKVESVKPMKSAVSTYTKNSKQASRHKEVDGSTRDHHHSKESSKHKTDERRTVSLKQSSKKSSKSGKSDSSSSTVLKLSKSSKKAESSNKIVLNQTTKSKADKAEKKSRSTDYETKKKIITYESEKKPLPTTRSPEKIKSKRSSLKDHRAEPKKKKIITVASSVNIVKKKCRKCSSDEEEEEEKTSHSVGSKVSVPTKKPRLAPHQRANTVLLLKAISEATEDSVRQRIKREKSNAAEEDTVEEPPTTSKLNKDEAIKPYASKKAAARANVKKLIRKHITEEIDGNKFIAKKEVSNSTRVHEGKHKLAPPSKEEKNGSFVHVDPKRIKTLDLQSKVSGSSSTKTYRLQDSNEQEAKPDKNTTSARSSSPCFFVTLDCPVEKRKPATKSKASTTMISPKKFQPVPIQAPDSTTVLDEKSYNLNLVSTTTTEDQTICTDDEEDTEVSLTKLREKLAFMQQETKKLKETQERHLLMLQQAPGKPVNKLSSPDSATILPPDESKSIYIGNVHFSATEKQLAEHFSICGKVRRATILKDHYTGHPRGFAYLEFEEESSVEMALAFNNTQFCTRNLVVTKKDQATVNLKTPTFTRPRVPTRFFPRGGAFHGRLRPSRPFRGAGYGFAAPRPRFVASKNKTWVKPGYTPS